VGLPATQGGRILSPWGWGLNFFVEGIGFLINGEFFEVDGYRIEHCCSSFDCEELLHTVVESHCSHPYRIAIASV
jgi:hypothetical protein